MKKQTRYSVIFETSFLGESCRQYRETTVKRFRSFESAAKFAQEKSNANSKCSWTSYTDQEAFYVVRDNVSGEEKNFHGKKVPTCAELGYY